MFQKLTILTLLYLFCSPIATAQTRTNDFESWNSVFLTKEFNSRWSMTINPQFRAERNLTAMKSTLLSLAMNYKATSWYTFSPSVRYVVRPQWLGTLRLFADNVARNWIGNTDLQWHFRMRLQAERMLDNSGLWVYTARFRPHLIWKPQRKKWEFMLLSFEAYFSNNVSENWGYNRFRISTGLAYEVNKRCKIGLNYIAQSQPFNPRAELDHVAQIQVQATIGKPKAKTAVKVVAENDKPKQATAQQQP